MNSIVHFEIPSKDKERFIKFYSAVFDWKMHDIPEMGYTMVYTTDVDEQYMPKQAGAINGGMVSFEDNGGLNPILVIDVPNLDEYIKKIEEAGGKIVRPKTKVGDMGWYARFEDTEGVTMGIWQNIM